MLINFTKMQGLGNDFMVINNLNLQFQPAPTLIQQWSDRRFGIGFDQLLLVEPAKNRQADFFYRIFNADGSEVAQCGNGARCLARFLQDEKIADKNPIYVETLAGILELKLESDSNVTVNMGVPIIESTRLLKVGQQQLEVCILSLGNPHCVLITNDTTTAPVAELGVALNQHPHFLAGVNVGFMQILNSQQIKLRVFERGAGETLACGSGACAAVIAGCVLKQLDNKVTVEQPGGQLIIHWPNETGPVYLTGPAVSVFSGVINY